MKKQLTTIVHLALLCAPTAAYAQDSTPKGLLGSTQASSGSTDVAADGFNSAERPDDTRNATQLNVAAGGVLASGNARSLAATAASDFKLRREKHQLKAAAAANYARSAPDRDSSMEGTVENYQAKVRYDYFFFKQLAAFLAMSGRHDRFQGLDLRLNVDPGLAYYFIDVQNHQFWAEFGYDLQFDSRTSAAVDEALAADGTVLDKTELRHQGRAFVGYDNKLNAAVTFNAGLEYLQGLSPARDELTDRLNWQLNTQLGLTSKVSDKFSVATAMSLRFDNNPLPDFERLDALTSVNLVYTLF